MADMQLSCRDENEDEERVGHSPSGLGFEDQGSSPGLLGSWEESEEPGLEAPGATSLPHPADGKTER